MAEAGTKQRVRVAIFGQEYALLANAEPEYVRRLAGRVDEVMRRLAEQHQAQDTVRLAVLTALSFADEVERLKDHQQELTELLEAEWRRRAAHEPRSKHQPG